MVLDLLQPDHPQLTPVSPRLATARRVSSALFFAIPAITGAVLAALVQPAFWALTGSAVAAWAVSFWVIGRRVSAHRYLEDRADIIVARGRWWRQVTVVPYGRIQFVDLDEGPLLRLFGLARLQLNTASATSDAAIDGIPRAAAQELRERLSERAREAMAGL